MTLRKIVNPSDQTQAFLPQFVGENYQTFVNFMAKAAEAQERQGFGQDLLQNLQRYRDFDTYSKGVVETGVLAAGVSLDEEDEILLENGADPYIENDLGMNAFDVCNSAGPFPSVYRALQKHVNEE